MENLNKEMDIFSFNMKINAAGNVSIETYDDFGNIYKETGFGYDKTSFALTQLADDRLNISQEQKSMIQSGSFISGIESLSERLGGEFSMEEIDKNHYFCKLKLPKENFYSDECMKQKRLVESTNSVKVILNSLNSEFDVVKKSANFQMNEMFEKDPNKILNFISNSEDSIKKEIVSNPYAKKEILDYLSKDENEDIRKKIAIHPRVSVDTLNVLSNDFNNYVRAYVASNPKTPINILEKLSNKGELEIVREEVAKNKSTPITILDKFLNDKSETYSVKFLSLLNVASNPNTPKEILKNLEKHIDREEVALGFLSNKNTSTELLEKISNIKYDSPLVKEELLKNPKLTIEILEKISQDDNSFLRYMVVSNPLVTKEILDKLSQDNDLQVSSKALEKLSELTNKNDNSILLEVLEDYVDKDTNTHTHTR